MPRRSNFGEARVTEKRVQCNAKELAFLRSLPYYRVIQSKVSDETTWEISFINSEDKKVSYMTKKQLLIDLGVNGNNIKPFLMDDISK